jgi:hypothetical protein
MVERSELIQGLRDLATFLESYPEIPTPSFGVDAWVNSKEELTNASRLGGKWEKRYTGNYFCLGKRFGPILFEINTERDKVCRRVVVGTETIPAQPERTVEKVEWICDEPLLAGN